MDKGTLTPYTDSLIATNEPPLSALMGTGDAGISLAAGLSSAQNMDTDNEEVDMTPSHLVREAEEVDFSLKISIGNFTLLPVISSQ